MISSLGATIAPPENLQYVPPAEQRPSTQARERSEKPSSVISTRNASLVRLREPAAASFDRLWQGLRTEGIFACFDLGVILLSVSLCMALLPVEHTSMAAGIMLPASVAMLFSFWLLGNYSAVGLSPVVELRQIVLGISSIFLLLVFVVPVLWSNSLSVLGFLLTAWGICVVSVPLSRLVAREVLHVLPWWGHRALIFSMGENCGEVLQQITSNPRSGLRPMGVLDINEFHAEWDENWLGSQYEQGEQPTVNWAIIIAPDRLQSEALMFVDRYAPQIPNRLLISGSTQIPTLWTQFQECNGTSGLAMREQLAFPASMFFKRTADVILVTLGLLALSPLFAVIGLAIKLTSRGPVFYTQERIGHSGRVFHMLKFRSMVTNGDEILESHLRENPAAKEEWINDHKLTNDPRLTSIGRFLRKSSLDELPQLWNVLRGDMSLVGPRPIVNNAEGLEYVLDYPRAFETYCKVRPGITGLWQISGRNSTTFARRVQCDSYYVGNWSPWLDVFILARTIIVVLRQEGAC